MDDFNDSILSGVIRDWPNPSRPRYETYCVPPDAAHPFDVSADDRAWFAEFFQAVGERPKPYPPPFTEPC